MIKKKKSIKSSINYFTQYSSDFSFSFINYQLQKISIKI